MDYKYTDKLYKQYTLLIVRAFNSLNREFQALDFDELNAGKSYKAVTEKVTKTYKKVLDELIQMLILLSVHYFEESCDTVVSKKDNKITYYVGKKDGFRKDKTFDAEKFVIAYLGEDNPVVKYVFNNEYERKLARAVESVLMSANKSEMKKELDKAMRYWNTQAKQAGDNISMNAYTEGFRAVGVKKVKWVTQDDTRVCEGCESRNGKVYDIDKIRIPLHYNCRCYFTPVK